MIQRKSVRSNKRAIKLKRYKTSGVIYSIPKRESILESLCKSNINNINININIHQTNKDDEEIKYNDNFFDNKKIDSTTIKEETEKK